MSKITVANVNDLKELQIIYRIDEEQHNNYYVIKKFVGKGLLDNFEIIAQAVIITEQDGEIKVVGNLTVSDFIISTSAERRITSTQAVDEWHITPHFVDEEEFKIYFQQ